MEGEEKLLLIGGGRCWSVLAVGWSGWFWWMKIDVFVGREAAAMNF